MSYDYNALVTEFVQQRQAAATVSNIVDDSNSHSHNGDETTPLQQQQQEKRQQHLQAAVQALETLSSHCPLTPLLWIQYAAALRDWLQSMGADEATMNTSQRQLLALGCSSFPGSLLLHARHVQACIDDAAQNDSNDIITEAIETAIQQVGRGSYRRQCKLVLWLYQTWANHLRQQGKLSQAYDVYCQQAQVPLPANDELRYTVETWAQDYKSTQDEETNIQNQQPASVPAHVWQSIEQGRRVAAQVYCGNPNDNDDEIYAKLQQEGLLDEDYLEWNDTGSTIINWRKVEIPSGQRYGMGYGGTDLAQLFSKFAMACEYYEDNQDDDENGDDDDGDDDCLRKIRKHIQKQKRTVLPWSIYERGIAECPTVESLWLSYLKDMQKRGTTQQRHHTLPALVKRACQNCPYSIALLKFDLNLTLRLVQEDAVDELEPDVLLQRVQMAWDTKFLPGGAATWCDLVLQIAGMARQRILTLLLDGFDIDDKKQVDDAATKAASSWNNETQQRVEDLVADLKDLYEMIRKNHHQQFPKDVAGRTRIMQEETMTDYHLMGPLARTLNSSESKVLSAAIESSIKETREGLAKAARLHPHPDTYLTWIQFWQYNKETPTNPTDVAHSLAQIRCAFVLAWQQASPKAVGRRDFQSALAALAHEWISWEALFGSTQSEQRAQNAVQKRYRKVQEQNEKQRKRENKQGERHKRSFQQTTVHEDPPPKRARVQESSKPKPTAASHERPKVVNSNVQMQIDPEHEKTLAPESFQETKKDQEKMDVDVSAEKKPTDVQPKESKLKKDGPRVTINGIEYPAHPFTVRVSNLANDVEDMDLVDLLRPICGAIVHARIVREKGHGKTKSKGWGLVQFEEADSVDKALKLSEELGLREKLVKIERSNIPAAFLVPPGLHRLNPKGEGRSSKRNEKKKRKTDVLDEKHPSAVDTSDSSQKPKPQSEAAKKSGPISVLSLAPRGVLKKASRPKPKITAPKEGESNC